MVATQCGCAEQSASVVGDSDGLVEGLVVGNTVGELVGPALGAVLGDPLGLVVGEPLGFAVGVLLGLAVGLALGANDGLALGARVGRGVSHVPAALHTSLAQSASPKHVCPTSQRAGHTSPPQSTAVSSPFSRPSLHDEADGDRVGLVDGESLGSGVGLDVGLVVGIFVVGANVGANVLSQHPRNTAPFVGQHCCPTSSPSAMQRSCSEQS